MELWLEINTEIFITKTHCVKHVLKDDIFKKCQGKRENRMNKMPIIAEAK